MSLRSWIGAMSLAVGTLLGAGAVEAADLATTINVQGMHCVSCARKITSQLQAVPEVGSVKADAETGLVTIDPRVQIAPSPRLLWEAVERAGYKPVQIISPYGTFKEKPKS